MTRLHHKIKFAAKMPIARTRPKVGRFVDITGADSSMTRADVDAGNDLHELLDTTACRKFTFQPEHVFPLPYFLQ